MCESLPKLDKAIRTAHSLDPDLAEALVEVSAALTDIRKRLDRLERRDFPSSDVCDR